MDEWSRIQTTQAFCVLLFVSRLLCTVMVKNCCVVGCHNVFIKGKISFYRFPSAIKYPVKRSKWIAAVKRENWVPNRNTWICSEHFVTGQKSNDALAPNYIPTIFPQVKSPAKRKLENSAAVFERRQATKRKRLYVVQQQALSSREENEGEAEDGNESDDDDDESNTDPDNASDIADDQVVADEIVDDTSDDLEEEEDDEAIMMPFSEDATDHEPVFRCDFCKDLEDELSTAKKHCKHLELVNEKLTAKVVSRESLRNDDIKVQYYTGLPSYEILEIVFEFVTVGVPDSFATSSCSVFDQFLMVLMRLRLNAGIQDLGYRFHVHPSTLASGLMCCTQSCMFL